MIQVSCGKDVVTIDAAEFEIGLRDTVAVADVLKLLASITTGKPYLDDSRLEYMSSAFHVLGEYLTIRTQITRSQASTCEAALF
jgi:hypothetical protein